MNQAPKVSANLAAYEWHIWVALQWLCSACGRYENAAEDIRESEKAEAPNGEWSWRKAREAMGAGWYIPPTQEPGSMSDHFCLCPECAAKRGLTIQNET